MGTDIQQCINCLCHARSGCWSRYNCARYSINYDYWQKAGSLTVDAEDKPDDEVSYLNCLRNENCIVATIAKYTEHFGEIVSNAVACVILKAC